MDILKNKFVWVGVAVVVIGGAFAIHSHNHRQVDLSNQIKVTYNGYDTDGVISPDNTKFEKELYKLYAKRSGLSQYQVQQLRSTSSRNSVISSLPSDQQDKATEVAKWLDEVKFKYSNETNLKNGELVKLTIDNGNDKTNPVKFSVRTFKVSGLRKTKTISTSKYLKTIKTSFSGINGHGRVLLKSSNSMFSSAYVKNNGKLSNGDTVTISLMSSFENGRGTNYVGSREIKAKVSGLVDPSQISNVSEIASAFQPDAEKAASADAYENVTPLGIYLIEHDSNSSSGISEGKAYFDDDGSNVTYEVRALYKANSEVSKSFTRVYRVYMENLTLSGNELHSDGGFQSKEADIRRYVTYSDDMNKELSDVKSYDAIKLQ